MRKRFVAAALGLLSCAEPISDVDAQRAALGGGSFDPMPVVLGTIQNGKMGQTVAACPGGGFVAGALGSLQTWVSPTQVLVPTQQPQGVTLPTMPVACFREAGEVQAWRGGQSWADLVNFDGGVTRKAYYRVDTIATAPSQPLVLADAELGIIGPWVPGVPSLDAGPHVARSKEFGRAMAWNHSGGLVVGNPTARTFEVFTIVDGGFAGFPATADPNLDMRSDFGRVVAAGSVTPDAFDEVIVGAPAVGSVTVFSGGQLKLQLSAGAGAGFGSAIAIDPRDLGGDVHAYWVSNPITGQIFHVIGNDMQQLSIPSTTNGTGIGLGTSLAVEDDGTLLIGAPLFGSITCGSCGAVFRATFDAGIQGGTGMACVANTPCALPNCRVGTCIGDVFCSDVSARCLIGEVCVNEVCGIPLPDAGMRDAGSLDAGAAPDDAGTPDAGARGAGTVEDAGIRDAGAVDAGSSDAGTVLVDAGAPDAGAPDGGTLDVQFGAVGCRSTPSLLGALALGLLGRRRRR